MILADTDSRILEQMAVMLGIKFEFNGSPLSGEEVFAADGALPLIYFAANQMAIDLEMESLGCGIRKAEASLCGAEATLESNARGSTRILVCLDVITEAIREGLTEDNIYDISNLFNKYGAAMHEQLSMVKPEIV